MVQKFSKYKFLKYLIVSFTAVSFELFAFCIFTFVLKIDYRISIFLSFTIGTLTHFYLCHLFVFNKKSLHIFEAGIRHYLSSIGGLLTNELVMIFLIEVMIFPSMFFAKVIASGISFFVNYTLIHLFAFNDRIKFRDLFEKEVLEEI